VESHGNNKWFKVLQTNNGGEYIIMNFH